MNAVLVKLFLTLVFLRQRLGWQDERNRHQNSGNNP